MDSVIHKSNVGPREVLMQTSAAISLRDRLAQRDERCPLQLLMDRRTDRLTNYAAKRTYRLTKNTTDKQTD